MVIGDVYCSVIEGCVEVSISVALGNGPQR